MKKRTKLIVLQLMMLACMCVGCSDMNDLHDKYLQQGETIYLAKFDSIKIYPGRYRARVDYWLTDPKAAKCQIEWNMGASTEVVDVSNTTGEAPNSFFLTDLQETTISFDFNTLSEDMVYYSLKTNVTATIYGDKYASTLLNATVIDAKYSEENESLSFKWNANYSGVIGYKIKYMDLAGTFQEIRLDITEDRKVELQRFPENGSFEYTTIYLPIEGAIDEFELPYKTYALVEEPWTLAKEMNVDASLIGADWESVNDYMKNFNFEYTEHPNDVDNDHVDGTHIEVVNDAILGKPVFKFNIHASADENGNIAILDGDRGTLKDRQRNEMKSRTGDGRYEVNGNWEEEQKLEWLFKIPVGFRPTTSFTHIHQLKAQEGNNGSPLITITPRANSDGSNKRIQIIHTGDTSDTNLGTLIEVPMSDFEGEWVKVTEEVYYSHKGTYSIVITRISDGKVLLECKSKNIDMWRKGATNIRNKFGIYRSFGSEVKNNKFPTNGIKDESLYLADFKIYERYANSNPEAHE